MPVKSAESVEREAAIARARAETTPDAIISGVKEVVAREILELSSDAKVVTTPYFNHTYMPDFILEWREAGKASSRPVFIRNHLSDVLAAREVEALGAREPVVLGLDTIEAEEAPVLRDVSAHSRLLFSDVSSIDTLARAADASADNPLFGLVRSNVLRGGKGLLSSEEVDTVSDATDLAPEAGDASDRLARFSSMAATMFEEGAAIRLLRAADIVRLSLLGKDEPFVAAVEGHLDDADLRILLPYLLDTDRTIVNTAFWRYIGSMMDLKRLEEFASALEGRRLDDLVLPNLELWAAKRAQLSLNSVFDEDSDEGTSISWGISSNGVLTAVAGPYLVAVASSGRRLKTRENSRLPTWRNIEPIASRYRLDEITLRGVVRRVRVSAEESGDVAGDVRRIADSLKDSYSVDELTVRRIGSDSETGIDVDFPTWLVTAEKHEPASDIVAAAIDFLAHAKPLTPERRAALLGEAAPSANETA